MITALKPQIITPSPSLTLVKQPSQKQELSPWIWNQWRDCYEKYIFAVLIDEWYNPKDKFNWVSLEEYSEDSLNGGESTGFIVHARLGDSVGELPDIGRSCDGRLYSSAKHKHLLFVASSSNFE